MSVDVIKKLLFLDIDGVLNSAQSSEMYHYFFEKKSLLRDSFCVNAVAMLYKILREHPDCKIVISSTWRLNHSLSEIFNEIPNRNIKEVIDSRVIGATPHLRDRVTVGMDVESRSHFRGEEIQAWIDDNKNILSKDLRFVILDDDSDMGYLYTHLVQTDGHVGLTYRDALKVINQLKTREERKKDEIREALRQIRRVSFTLENESEINILADNIENLIR